MRAQGSITALRGVHRAGRRHQDAILPLCSDRSAAETAGKQTLGDKTEGNGTVQLEKEHAKGSMAPPGAHSADGTNELFIKGRRRVDGFQRSTRYSG